jgi:hypothetical protein
VKDKEKWEIEFRLLMGKVVGWRNVEVDIELESFITSLLQKERKKTLEEVEEILENELYLAHTTESGKTSRLTSAIMRIDRLSHLNK